MKKTLIALLMVVVLAALLAIPAMADETGPITASSADEVSRAISDITNYQKQYVKLMDDISGIVTVNEPVYIDLNGKNIETLDIASGVEVHVFDSATNDYSVAVDTQGREYGKITNVIGKLVYDFVTPEGLLEGKQYRYVTIQHTEEGFTGYSSHRIYIGVTHSILVPSKAKVEFNTVYLMDEVLAQYANAGGYGAEVNLRDKDGTELVGSTVTVDYTKKEYGSKVLQEYSSDEEVSTAQKQNHRRVHVDEILTDKNGEAVGLETQKLYAEYKIEAKAYIQFADGIGTKITSASVKRSLKDVTIIAQQQVLQMTDEQSTALTNMYTRYKDLVNSWNDRDDLTVSIPVHCVCGGKDGGGHYDGCNGEPHVWQPWNAWGTPEGEMKVLNSLPTQDGYWYIPYNAAGIKLATNTQFTDLDADRAVYLDINGNTINFAKNDRLIATYSDSDTELATKYVLTNAKTQGLIRGQDGSGSNGQGGLIWVYGTNNSVDVYNVDIDASLLTSSMGTAFGVQGGGSLNVYGATVCGGVATGSNTTGGAVWVNGGTVNVVDSSIVGGQATYGGAFYIDNGTVTLGGDAFVGTGEYNEITYTASAAHGGAAWLQPNGKLIVTGNATISGASSTKTGGAIYNQGTLQIDGGTLVGGTAIDGGAIYNTATMTMTGGVITGGTVTGNGGAIWTSGNVTISGGTVNGSSAALGGAIFVNATKLTVDGGTVTGGSANDGGTIYNNQGTVDIKSGSVGGGTATGNGGAILNGGPLHMTGGTIIGGKAENGGAVWSNNTITVEDGTIVGGTAKNGGVIWTSNTVTISGGEVLGGTATNAAGTLFIQGGSVEISGDALVGEGKYNGQLYKPTALFAGAIWNFGSGLTLSENAQIVGGEATSATGDGGTIYNGAPFTMTGGAVIGGTTKRNGGAIYNTNTVTVSGGTITGGKAASGGGGAIFSNNGTVTLSGTAHVGKAEVDGEEYNSSAAYGGVFYINAGTLKVEEGAVLSGGSTSTIGGTVFSTGAVEVNGGTINGGHAGSNGGAVYIRGASGSLTMNGGTITGGHANGLAGNVYLENGTLTMSGNAAVTGGTCNTSAFMAGDIYNDNGDISMSGNAHLGYLYAVNKGAGDRATLKVKDAVKVDCFARGVVNTEIQPLVTIENALNDDAMINLHADVSGIVTETTTMGQEAYFSSVSGGLVEFKDACITVNNERVIHCMCGRVTSLNQECDDCGEKAVEWTPFDCDIGGYYNLNVAGNYYLTGDLHKDGNDNLVVNHNGTSDAEIRLDLNGYNIIAGSATAFSTYKPCTLWLTNTSVNPNHNEQQGGEIRSSNKNYVVNMTQSSTLHIMDGITIRNTNNNSTYSLIRAYGTVNMHGGLIDASNITAATAGGAVNVATEYNVNSSFNMSGGTILGANLTTKDAMGGAVYVNAGGTLNVSGGTITGGTAAQGGAIWTSGTVDVTGGSILGGQTTFGGNIFINAGIVTLGGNAVIGSGEYNETTYTASADHGGVAWVQSGKLIVTGNATISGANSTKTGGSIYNQGTVEINGGTLTGGKATGGGAIYNTGTVTMTDGTIVGGKVSGDGGAIYNSGTLTVEGGKIVGGESTNSGGAIFIANNATMKLRGDAFIGDTTDDKASSPYGGVIRNRGTVNMEGGRIAGGTSTHGHGGTISNTGKWTMTDGTIEGGTAKKDDTTGFGGAIENTGTLDIRGGTVVGGKAVNGGVIWTNNTVTISGGKVLGGTASNAAGTLFISGGTVEISGNALVGEGAYNGQLYKPTALFAGAIWNYGTGLTVSENAQIVGGESTNGDGGTIYNGAPFTMDGGAVIGGTATGNGGAIYNINTVTVNNGSITSGSANEGGTIYNIGTVEINSGSVGGGTATGIGGAIVNGGTLTISGGTVTAGTAGGNGGTIWTNKPVTISGGTVNGGTAALGGAIFNNASTVTVDGGSVTGGSATEGGTIYNNQGTVEIKSGSVGGGEATVTGGAIVNGGTLNISGGTVTAGTAGGNGGTIWSNNEVTISGNAIVEGGKAYDGGAIYNSCTLTVEGGKIVGGESTNSGGAIFIAEKATMNLRGDAFIGDTTVDDKAYTASSPYGGVIRNRGTVNMEGGRIAGGTSTHGHGGTISNTGKWTMTDGTIEGGTAKKDDTTGFGGAIENTGTLDIQGGTVVGGEAVNGGTIWNSMDVTISGNAIVEGGNATSHGGAIFTKGTLNISGGKVIGGTATNYGGSIFMESGSTTINGTAFVGEDTVDGTPKKPIAKLGGTIFVNAGTLTLDGDAVVFMGSATESGGSIFTTGTITMNGGTIVGGEAPRGGAVYVKKANMSMTAGKIIGGTAAEYGGNFFIENGNVVLKDNAVIGSGEYNETTYTASAVHGGAVWVQTGTLTATDNVTISGANATKSGGLIYNNVGTVNLNGTTLSNGSTGGDVGAIYNNGSTTLKNVTFSENTAATNGNDVWNNATLTLGGNINMPNGLYLEIGKHFTLSETVTGTVNLTLTLPEGQVSTVAAANSESTAAFLVNGVTDKVRVHSDGYLYIPVTSANGAILVGYGEGDLNPTEQQLAATRDGWVDDYDGKSPPLFLAGNGINTPGETIGTSNTVAGAAEWDKLKAIAVAMTDEQGDTILMISVDTMSISVKETDNVSKLLREEISKKTGVPYDNIMLAATHTHSALALSASTAFKDKNGNEQVLDKTYRQVFFEGVVDAAVKAVKNRKRVSNVQLLKVNDVNDKVKDSWGRKKVFNQVRDYIVKDIYGTEIGVSSPHHNTWDDNTLFKTYTPFSNDVDDSLQLVKYTFVTGEPVIIANFQTHANLNSDQDNTQITADIVGAFRYHLGVNAEANVLYFSGAGGDVSPNASHNDQSFGQDEYKEWGEKLAGLATGSWTVLETPNDVKMKTEEVTYPLMSETKDRYEKAQKILDANSDIVGGYANNSPYVTTDKIFSSFHAKTIIERYERVEKGATEGKVKLYAFSVGNVGFVGAPYEMFNDNGMFIKSKASEELGYEATIISTICNGNESYVPSSTAYQNGSYGVDLTKYAAGSGEHFAEEFVELLDGLN